MKNPHLNFMVHTAIELVNYYDGLVLSNVDGCAYVNHQMILLCSMPLISFFQLWTETWLVIYHILKKRVLL